MSLHFFLRGRGIFITISLLSLFKQHVTFSKTTRCFPQNDTLFSVKRHVVFFTESSIAARRFCHSLLTATQSFFPLSQFCFLRVQTFLKNLLLTRAYAHASQEFLPFCCHKCHSLFLNHYISNNCN